MTTPEENDDIFKKIMEGMGTAGEDGEASASIPVTSIWDALVALWPKAYDGMITKAVIIAEYVTSGSRGVRVLESPGIMEWEAMGLIKFATLFSDHIALCGGVEEEEEDD